MNKTLCNDLAIATSYFSECKKIEDSLLTEQAQILLSASEAQEERDERNKIPGIIGMIGTGVFFIFLAFVAVGLILSLFVDISYLLGSISYAILMGIGYLLKITGKKLEDKNNERFKRKIDTEVKPIADEANKKIEKLKQIMENFVNENLHYIEFIPIKYRNLEAVSYMFIAASNGRADTLKEAINLYEEQLHRWNLEMAANKVAEAQQYTARAIDELNRQQRETNNHLKAIEFIEYINYLNK